MKLLLIILFMVLARMSYAADEPSFWHKKLSERSTHIILASEGLKIDGSLTVLASYKGDISAGTTIKLPQLIDFKDRASRKIAPSSHSKQKRNPVHPEVTCSVMILFLVAGEDGFKSPEFTDGHTWIYWIEDGIGYARVQEGNSGKSEIREFFIPLNEVLRDIKKCRCCWAIRYRRVVQIYDFRTINPFVKLALPVADRQSFEAQHEHD